MFYRKMIKELKEWKSRAGRKPLIIRGARQVGKTTLVELFSREFKQYIYLNLEIPSDNKIFDEKEDFETIIDSIYFLKGKSKSISETLLFIDEIQNSPVAVKLLRYFYEKKPDLYVVAAGSLLETIFNKDISFPVGRVEYLILRPFSFEEFLIASGETNSLEILNEIPIPGYANNKLEKLFHIYSLIGGMPEVVCAYLEMKDLTSVKKVITNLIVSFKDDVEKYAKNISAVNIIRHVIENSFLYAGSRIKFNGFGNSPYRSREVGEAFRTLEKTNLLQLVYPVADSSLPLQPDRKKSPKLQLMDTGIVNFSAGIEKDVFNSKDLTDVFRGKIAEHIIGQQLLTYENSPLHKNNFWVNVKGQSSAEIDFLHKSNNTLYPIEVKSGSSGRLKSLHQFMDLSKLKIAIRFYAGNVVVDKVRTPNRHEFILLNLPFYLSGEVNEYILWVESNYLK